MSEPEQAPQTPPEGVQQPPETPAPEATAEQAPQGAAPQPEQAPVQQQAPQDPPSPEVRPEDEPPVPDFTYPASYHDLPNPNTLRGVPAGPEEHPRMVEHFKRNG